MAIACVYCGGEHPSASLVRQCWEQSNGQQKLSVANPEPKPDQVERVAGRTPRAKSTVPATAKSASPSVAVPAKAGPDALGRNLIVEPGQSVPSPWAAAERVFVDADTFSEPAPVLTVLRAAGHARRRIVIELHPNHTNCSPQSLVSAVPVLQFGGLLEFGEFEADELVHLIWSNAVDLRDPDLPRWEALDAAVGLGALPTGGGPRGTVGDIILPNGEPVWIDGGPIRHTGAVDGVPVLHAVAIEHGSLRPPGPNVSRADLAPDQLAAVTHPGGAARIIAPAGSGKTRVLTERARLLLDTWNLPPSAVSLVAFNKRAQEDMTERTADLPRLQVRTLNAIALAIVNGTPPFAPQQRSWRTIDEIDVRRIIGELVTFPRRRNSDPVAPWIEALSLIRLGLLSPEEVEGRYDGEVDGLAGVWPLYRQALDRM
ncbi:MAG: AAA family ATPase, partial [Actinomycetota bacterium]|nr:AAA family ATPase [Actinomycetota bacterium]